MKVALVTPWDNAWIPYLKQAVEKRGHDFILKNTWHEDPLSSARRSGLYDVVLHGWSNGASQPVDGARNVFFLRRYELFDGALTKVYWKNVDALIVVNSWIKQIVENNFKCRGITVPVHLIYNGTDLSKWTYKERKPGKRIGMACHVHPKKNLPLALQILGRLPEDYELHIAGEVQDPCTAEYLNHVGKQMGRKVYLYGHIPREQLNLWWEQMNYCLSTSISEGNPNNVIEAMAKGIKPIVHNWPGAEDQFNTFNTIEQAIWQIHGPYESSAYRDWVGKYFSLENYERVLDIALQPKEMAA